MSPWLWFAELYIYWKLVYSTIWYSIHSLTISRWLRLPICRGPSQHLVRFSVRDKYKQKIFGYTLFPLHYLQTHICVVFTIIQPRGKQHNSGNINPYYDVQCQNSRQNKNRWHIFLSRCVIHVSYKPPIGIIVLNYPPPPPPLAKLKTCYIVKLFVFPFKKLFDTKKAHHCLQWHLMNHMNCPWIRRIVHCDISYKTGRRDICKIVVPW